MKRTLIALLFPFASYACSITSTSEVDISTDDEKSIHEVLKTFHCGLAEHSTEMIMSTYHPDQAFLLTNVPTDAFEKSLWPCKKNSERIMQGKPIQGHDALRTYQDSVFSAGTFSDVTSNLVFLQVDRDLAHAISYGTHHFTLKGKASHTLAVQDTAAWTLMRDKNGKWSILSVNFVDKIREKGSCK